jgi:phosphate transport system protein
MRHLDEKIQELLERLLRMGRLAESMIQTALRVLIERNESLGDDIYRKEEEVNNLQIEIDDSAVKLTALQQPVGTDVRFLFMASRIAT